MLLFDNILLEYVPIQKIRLALYVAPEIFKKTELTLAERSLPEFVFDLVIKKLSDGFSEQVEKIQTVPQSTSRTNAHSATLALPLGVAKACLQLAPLQSTA